jgi:hypothetical protein
MDDYPGYTNIRFQRARHFVFSFFRLDLDSMSRFAAMTDDFLVREVEIRKSQEGPAATRSVAELTGSFTDILLSWMIVGLYGRFESFLFDVCLALHDSGVHSENPGRLSNIGDAKDYLKHIPNLKFPSATKEWMEIKDLAELRNVIVHNNRIMREEGREKRQQALARIPHVSISVRNEVWIERGILEYAAN